MSCPVDNKFLKVGKQNLIQIDAIVMPCIVNVPSKTAPPTACFGVYVM